MVYFKLLEILAILCIINKTTAFKCWCCSSDEEDSEFCGKVLDESKLTYNQKLVNLVQCSYPHFDLSKGRDLITKCMIQQTSNYGKIVYSRSCVWEERNAEKDACLSHTPPYGHRVITCETCVEDKCNDRLISDNHNSCTYMVAMYNIMFICIVFILII